jgi:hypothetical protein
MSARAARFFGLTLLLSAPLWLAASFFDATRVIPVRLPLSALQFLAVLASALVVARRDQRSMRAFLSRGFDARRIRGAWRFGVLALMPATVALSWVLARMNGASASSASTPFIAAPVFLLGYGLSAYCEQLGFMTDDLLDGGRGVIAAGFLVGTAWATWHIVPFFQTHHTTTWIAWQCIYSIIFRVLLTKVYVLTERSVFATIAMHATYNTAFTSLPLYGSSYQPAFMAAATASVTLTIFVTSRPRATT